MIGPSKLFGVGFVHARRNEPSHRHVAIIKISTWSFLNLAHQVLVLLKLLFGEACASVELGAGLFKQLLHGGDVCSPSGSVFNNRPKCSCIRSEGLDLGLVSVSGSGIELRK